MNMEVEIEKINNLNIPSQSAPQLQNITINNTIDREIPSLGLEVNGNQRSYEARLKQANVDVRDVGIQKNDLPHYDRSIGLNKLANNRKNVERNLLANLD